MKRTLLALLVLAASLLVPLAPAGAAKPTPAPATSNTVAWIGNGMTGDGSGGWTLTTSDCSVDASAHLLFVLSATKASTATIAVGSGAPISIGKPTIDKNGWSTFKYTLTSVAAIDLGALLASPVTAAYNDAKDKGVLTVSHGCVGSPPASGCLSAPVNTTLPVVTYDRFTEGVSTTDGSWQSITGCTNTYTYAWEAESWGGAGYVWTSMASTASSATAGYCDFAVRATVTATNEFGSTSATSAQTSTGYNC